ncbi:hypothetical protein ACWKWU_00595 [Chitinophaga lutea]
MPEQLLHTPFEAICGEHDTWVVAYESAVLGGKVHMVWYTDRKLGDRLLTFSNGDIFAVPDLADLRPQILRHGDELLSGPQLPAWLEATAGLKPVVGNTYRADRIARCIGNRRLDLAALDGLSNFIDLFGDYANSIQDTSRLEVFRNNPLIAGVAAYYYRNIFWPRLNDEAAFATRRRPGLKVDYDALLTVFAGMRRELETAVRVL